MTVPVACARCGSLPVKSESPWMKSLCPVCLEEPEPQTIIHLSCEWRYVRRRQPARIAERP